MKPLNLFYEEPEADRWFKYDRYPRRFIRRIVRGKQQPGGVMMIIISLMRGFDKLGIPYRFNDYNYINKHPEEIACLIGKHHLLFKKNWKNPIIYGPGIYSHPVEYPDLFENHPNVKLFLVPGEWMRKMCESYYGAKVISWPAGIDTEDWVPLKKSYEFDFLIYDKIRWEHDFWEDELINPIIKVLDQQQYKYQFITYGSYDHKELKSKLSNSKAVIFLTKHETQGFAYQQILSTNTPIFAWDRGGYWEDPSYYPHKVQYQPVSSVPYWDERCGMKFTDVNDFKEKLPLFLNRINKFKPRDYILENLTLKVCAEKYLKIHQEVEKQIK